MRKHNAAVGHSAVTQFTTVTTADGCVHTADATRLDSFVSASAVCIGLLPMQATTWFRVDRHSGAVIVTSTVDREVSPNYTLAVMASDSPKVGHGLVTNGHRVSWVL